MKMGCLSSAVEVLTRLQMWEELAVCYHRVGRKAKAIEVVREQLTVRATPPLLCLLGDITQVCVYVCMPSYVCVCIPGYVSSGVCLAMCLVVYA